MILYVITGMGTTFLRLHSFFTKVITINRQKLNISLLYYYIIHIQFHTNLYSAFKKPTPSYLGQLLTPL